MLAIVDHENMKLGENTLNKDRLSLVLQYIKNLETQRSYERTVNLKNLKFLKKSIERFRNYLLVC